MICHWPPKFLLPTSFPLDFTDRVQQVIYYLFCIIFGIGIFQAFSVHQWFNSFLAFLCLLLMVLPAIAQRSFLFFLPIEFEVFFGFFLFITLYLGDIEGYYKIYWWWDKFLHTGSGILLGLVGFLIVYLLNNQRRIHLHLSPFFVALFSFTFAVMIGVFWEFFEFGMDQFFGTVMQRPPANFDTMTDLMVDALGALFVAFLGYFYVKKVKVPLFDRFITKFLDKNPRIFRRWRRRHERKQKSGSLDFLP